MEQGKILCEKNTIPIEKQEKAIKKVYSAFRVNFTITFSLVKNNT